jgi:hypothetical protein
MSEETRIRRRTPHERFMCKVNQLPGDGCWEWTACRNSKGYGQFWDGTRVLLAHWFLLDAYPPKGLDACHKCDNRVCVRPNHIFIGTRSDNMMDCSVKGRMSKTAHLAMQGKRKVWHKGEANVIHKLTHEQAVEAKNCPRKRGVATAMAKRFGVSVTVICGIRDGQRWRHLV